MWNVEGQYGDSLEFSPGELGGSKADFDKVYQKIKDSIESVSSKAAAKRWLCAAGLTPHHLDAETIQLIPSNLHGNVPHIGSASDLRILIGGKK